MRNIFLIFSALVLIPSCVKEVAMDAMEEPQVVVECILCDEPVQTLDLTYTKPKGPSSWYPAISAVTWKTRRTSSIAESVSRNSIISPLQSRLKDILKTISCLKWELWAIMSIIDRYGGALLHQNKIFIQKKEI